MAAPLVVALSLSKGRVTFGDSARVDDSVYVNGADVFLPESPVLAHPARTIFDRPRTYEFATPIAGTYPIWYDSSHWHEGLVPRFDLKEQIGAVTKALKLYVLLFVGGLEPLTVSTGAILLYALALRPRQSVSRIVAGWPILIPALAGFAGYALVVVDQRFQTIAAVLPMSALWNRQLIAGRCRRVGRGSPIERRTSGSGACSSRW